MKKNESPDLSAKWWKGSQPKALNKTTATKLEKALSDYEDEKKKLEASGDEDVAKSARDALGTVESAADAVIGEASKDKKDPEMGFTVDALKKLRKMCDAEAEWIEKNTGENEEGMFSDPEVYHDYLTKALKRVKTAGQMNFGMVLGKKAEDHRLALNKAKGAGTLGKMVAKETGLHAFTFGIATQDEGDEHALRLNLEGRQLAGLKKKGERMLKKFKQQTFKRIILVLKGVVVEDLADPDDTDVDEPDDEDTAATQSAGREAQEQAAEAKREEALRHELGELIKRIQALTNPATKGDLARMASQANGALNAKNLSEAAAAIERLRQALVAAEAAQKEANGGQATTGANAYEKSRDAWLDTRKKVEAEIEKLRSQIVATYQDAGIGAELDRLYRAKAAPVMTTLDESLAKKLDEVGKETNAARRVALVNQARDIITDYQSYVAGDATIPQLDKNPFVQLSIQQTVTATLSVLSRALH